MESVYITAIIAMILCFLAALFLVYKQYVKWQAKLEVKAQPREPMVECPKHGVFRKKHLIKHLDYEQCPFCFDEALKYKMDSTVKYQN